MRVELREEHRPIKISVDGAHKGSQTPRHYAELQSTQKKKLPQGRQTLLSLLSEPASRRGRSARPCHQIDTRSLPWWAYPANVVTSNQTESWTPEHRDDYSHLVKQQRLSYYTSPQVYSRIKFSSPHEELENYASVTATMKQIQADVQIIQILLFNTRIGLHFFARSQHA